MKTILITCFIIATAICNQLFAQEALTEVSGTEIVVTVPVQSTDGKVIFGLYNKENFMQQPLQGLMGEIKDGQAQVTFTNVTPGEYAITLFHDKNDDNQMNFDVNGMPLESYGVSNNVMSMGPPQWSDAVFTVANEPITLEIRM
ncbi:MAG: DUF2141 domain-containing protein [Gilvibacter sp.]